MICTLAFSAEGAAVVSGSIDGVLHAWDVRKVLDSRDPASRDAAKSTTVLDTRFGRVISSDCLMSTMHTKSSRVLGCQFSSRNVLLVAADFPA